MGLCYLNTVAGRGAKMGGFAMETKEGDTVRSILNGVEYKVRKIVKAWPSLNRKMGKAKLLQRSIP